MFRRDEIQTHQHDVHNIIITGLDSWLNERCPMHRHGCNFMRRRFKPRTGNLRHDLTVNCWTRSVPLLTGFKQVYFWNMLILASDLTGANVF